MSTSRRWTRVLALICVGGLGWAGWAWWAVHRDRNAINEIESEMTTGRFAIAARQLNALLARKPEWDEAAFLLGVCEQARGRNQAALAAWTRVTPGSKLAYEAVLAGMRLFHDRGEFAAAERIVVDAAEKPGNDRSDVRALLVPIYSQLGRLDEARRLIEERWERLNETGEGASERAIDLVRMHIELALRPNPVKDVRTYLGQAAGMAPDDDRVWLGRANLALRMGDYDDAKRLLEACLSRRPEDTSVWRARLEWGIATNQIDVVRGALAHLPADQSTPAQIHRLGAWLASRRSDVESERRELESLLAADPTFPGSTDRLAQLAEKGGQPARAAELMSKKAEIDGHQARYEQLFDRKQPIRDAEEIAGLAERLGRVFEARVFLTLAISEDPERDDLRRDLRRLSQSSATVARCGQTLADMLAHDADKVGKVDAKPAH